VPGVPSKSRDLADENNKILTEWKWFETTVLDNSTYIMEKTRHIQWSDEDHVRFVQDEHTHDIHSSRAS